MQGAGAGAGAHDLLAGPRAVDEVVQQNDLLAAGQAARGDAARALLQRELLVVAVQRLCVCVCTGGRSATDRLCL